MTTVAVIGAGIVGVATALWLQRDGFDVVLIDKAGPGEGTSYGNAGVLASCSVVPVTVPGLMAKAPRMLFSPSEPLFLKWGYLPKLAPWLMRFLSHANERDARRIAEGLTLITGDSVSEHQALASGTPAERYLAPADYVFAYRDRAHYEADGFAWDIRRKNGFTWRVLEGEAVRAYDPLLGEGVGVLAVCGDHGHIKDPGCYVKALAEAFQASGGRIVVGEVSDIAREAGAVTGVRVAGETIGCEAAVVATGVWSGPLCRALGLKVPMESERGYHLELYEPNRMPSAPVMVAAGKFVATPMEGRVRLAGIVEFGGLDAPPSKRPFDLLRSEIAKAMPGLSWREEKAWMGHRPTLSDSLPIVGALPQVKGVFAGFGHHHIGLTGGARTGRLLAQLVAGRRPNVDLSPFAPERFG